MRVPLLCLDTWNVKMARKNKKVIRYKRSGPFNLGVVVFAVIFLYMVISLVRYIVTPSISLYEVTLGSLSSDQYYTGLILREETVITSEYSGYVNYYLRENKKAAIGDLIYTIDEDGTVTALLNSASGDESSLSDEELEDLRSRLSDFSMSYSDSSFSELYDLSTTVSSLLMEYMNLNALEELSDAVEISDSFQKCYALLSGLIVYSTDGYESLTADEITAELFNTSGYEKTTYSGGSLVEEGGAVYKVITENDWSIIIELTEEEAEEYADTSSVTIEFVDEGLETDADFTIFTGADGGYYGKLDLQRYLVHFSDDRYVDIEIQSSSVEGLKIPVTAVTTKDFYLVPIDFLTTGGDSQEEGFIVQTTDEDGNVTTTFVEADIYQTGEEYYYVDPDDFEDGQVLIKPDSSETFTLSATAELQGVYNVNRGYAVFKQIEILDQNSEYYIVSQGMDYGLRLYDTIVLDASLVTEDQIITQ